MYSAIIIGYEQKTGCSLMYTSPVDLNNLNKVQPAAYCFATIISQVAAQLVRLVSLPLWPAADAEMS